MNDSFRPLNRRAVLRVLAASPWMASVAGWLPELRADPLCVVPVDHSCTSRRQDWAINAGQAPTCGDFERGLVGLTYWKACTGSSWRQVSLAEFSVGLNTAAPVTFYMHGYGASQPRALLESRLLATAAGDQTPFHFVSWFWPAAHRFGLGPRNNLREKMQAASAQGQYLANVVGQLEPNIPITLVSHSLGARGTASALQVLAARPTEKGRPLQATFLAGAIDACGLAPSGEYANAVSALQRFVWTVNPNDRVLRLMASLNGNDRLLGLKGVWARSAGSESRQFVQLDASSWVGRHHTVDHYTGSAALAARLRPFLVYRDTVPV